MYSKEGEEAILNWVCALTGEQISQLGELANGKIMAQILNRYTLENLSKILQITSESTASFSIKKSSWDELPIRTMIMLIFVS